MDDSDNHNDVDRDVCKFFSQSPVSLQEVEEFRPQVEARIEHVAELLESKDALRLYKEYLEKKKDEDPVEQQPIVDVDEDFLSLPDPRSYQTALLERAKQENIIVHLGTGKYKTVALLQYPLAASTYTFFS